jgi:hypothetical protein
MKDRIVRRKSTGIRRTPKNISRGFMEGGKSGVILAGNGVGGKVWAWGLLADTVNF